MIVETGGNIHQKGQISLSDCTVERVNYKSQPEAVGLERTRC